MCWGQAESHDGQRPTWCMGSGACWTDCPLLPEPAFLWAQGDRLDLGWESSSAYLTV